MKFEFVFHIKDMKNSETLHASFCILHYHSNRGKKMKLILGSQSPRRRELLGRMGLEFSVLTAEIDETKFETEDPEESVCRICREKAFAVANRLWLDNCSLSTVNCSLVLTADTIVVLDGKIMGKPRDEAEARAMLRALSGREHAVFTAFTLLPAGTQNETTGNRKQETGDGSTDCRDQSADWSRNDMFEAFTHCEKTAVKFRELTEAEIAAYVATGEPMDKAGAYGIQGLGSMLVEGVRGDYFTVMGLPICRLAQALKRYGIDPLNAEQ
jgi:septum formation protein